MVTVLLVHSHASVQAWFYDRLSQMPGTNLVLGAGDGEEPWRLLQEGRWG